MFFQELQRQMQMAFYSPDRHIQLFRYFFRFFPTQIGQEKDFSSLLGNFFQQFIQLLIKILGIQFFPGFIVVLQECGLFSQVLLIYIISQEL